MITTKHRNKYSEEAWAEMQEAWDEEAEENEDWLDKQEELVKQAASYLNQEFPQTSTETWTRAINSPDNIQFTDSHKEARFEAALNWIDKELK